jgi:hypothetical protein
LSYLKKSSLVSNTQYYSGWNPNRTWGFGRRGWNRRFWSQL